jgi:hypothetical protein
MLRNSNKPRGSSVNAGSTAARWRSVFIALLLALAIGSAGQISPTQAAPDNPADIYFEVWAFPEAPPPVCINKTLKIYVSVNKGIVKTINGKEYDLPRGMVSGGVTIHSSMSTSNVGTLTPESLPVEVDSGASSPGQVMFVFTAKQRGTTTLIFESNGVIGAGADVTGAPPDSMLTSLGQKVPAKKAEIPVKVIPCKFKVTTISRWIGPVYNTIATSDEAEVVADAQGNFTGSATVNYATPITDSSCSFSASDTPGQVDWSGTIDSDQLVLSGTFQPSMTSFSASCPPAPGTFSKQQQWTADPLPFRVALSGGGFTQAQGAPGVSGSAVIVVIPEECSGTASC